MGHGNDEILCTVCDVTYSPDQIAAKFIETIGKRGNMYNGKGICEVCYPNTLREYPPPSANNFKNVGIGHVQLKHIKL